MMNTRANPSMLPRLISLLVAMICAPSHAQPTFAPGTEVRVDDDAVSGGHYVVWTPTNHDPAETWPVVVYYHGQDGQPNTWLFREVTGGRDFIVVGMEYSERGVLRHNTEQRNAFIARELASFRTVRDALVDALNADPDRVVIAGFSKGGWLSSLFGDRLADELVGYAILGGGRLDQEKPPAKRAAVANTPVYLGAGDADFNIHWTRYAAWMYRGFKSDVTLEIYPGLGHELKPDARLLKDWLYASAVWAFESDRAAHDAWLVERVAEIESVGVPVDQWCKLRDLADEPRFDACSDAARATYQDAIAAKRRGAGVLDEIRAHERLQRLDRQELAFRLKRKSWPLPRILAGYDQIVDRYPTAPSAAEATARRNALRTEYGDGG